MQFASDQDLAAAIDSPELMIDGLLEVDWNRDGLYLHKYADMSWLTSHVVVDAGPLSGELPAEVNDISGFSSSQISITFGGKRFSDADANAAWSQQLAEQGLSAVQFFDRYNKLSPIFGKTVEGTPCRYTRRVTTTVGEKPVRQFTGWIRDVDIDELAQTVGISGTDVEDIAGARINLPVWAIGPGADNATQYNNDGDYAPLHPISVDWVYEECLRAAGRGTGPMPRPDAVAYWTVAGSWLPSLGGLGGPYPSKHNVTYESTWRTLKYGLGHNWASHNDYGRISGGDCWTTAVIDYPDRGSGGPTNYVGLSGWFESNGQPTAPAGYGSEVTVALDDTGIADPGYISLAVSNNGTASVLIYEAGASGSPNNGTYRIWAWSTPLVGGMHYIAARVTLASTSIAVNLYVDDVALPPTTTPSLTGGFKRTAPIRAGATNKAIARGRLAPCQHLQVYNGATAATYDPNQKHPKWYLAGGTAPSVRTLSKNEVSWLPDIKNRGAWDVLKEAASGELGILHTDEFGKIYFLNSEAAMFPGYYNFDTSVKKTLTRDRLQNIRIRPSSDRYRNAIAMSWTASRMIAKIVWQSPDAVKFYEKVGLTHRYAETLTDVAGIYGDFTAVSSAAAPATPNLYAVQASAVRADAITTQAPAGWTARAVLSPDQRTLTIDTSSGTSGAPVYVGAVNGATAPNLTVGGWGLDAKKTTRELLDSPPQIAARGTALLEVPDSPWRQSPTLVFQLSYFALLRCVSPLPLLDSITITADPRIQLRDFVLVEASSATYYCQVIGIRRSDGPDGSLDTLTLRVASEPNTWILDDPLLSILDSTTILA